MYGIDPELKYCPVCRDEYRADFSSCASCNRALVSGEELISSRSHNSEQESLEKAEITDKDSLVPFQRGGLQDMKNLQRLLEKANVPSILTKDENDCRKGCCGPELFVHIRKQDSQRASAVVQAEYEVTTATADYDLSTADAVFDQGAEMTNCPACGCQFMPTSTSCPDCGLHFS